MQYSKQIVKLINSWLADVVPVGYFQIDQDITTRDVIITNTQKKTYTKVSFDDIDNGQFLKIKEVITKIL